MGKFLAVLKKLKGNNPKTTWIGYVGLGGAVIYGVTSVLAGAPIERVIDEVLYPALLSFGFIVASDGGI